MRSSSPATHQLSGSSQQSRPMAAGPLLPLLVQKNSPQSTVNGIPNGDARAGRAAAPRTHSRSQNAAVASGGIFGLVQRGALPADYDLEPALTSDGPMRSVRAPLHVAPTGAARQPPRQAVMTETSGFKRMNDYKLDLGEIAKLPVSMSVGELKQWEQSEAATAASQTASRSRPSARGTNGAVGSPQAALSEATVEKSDASRDDPRTYTELLDLYSMHEFIIRRGKTLRNTPEFASFKRHYDASWGSIERVITALEQFLGTHGIDLAYIDGKRLAALAAYQPGHNAAADDLLECIANADEIEPQLKDASRQYDKGWHGNHQAAAKIQSAWRMHRQRIVYKHLLLGTRAAILIQRQWAIYRSHCATRRTIAALEQTRLQRWRQTMERFCANWPSIRDGRRTVIHIPSLSYPSFHAKRVPFYMAQQLGQLTRLCDLADPKVDVVLVAPFKPEPEVLDYSYSLLEEAGVPSAQNRFTLLVPEEARRLPDGMSLTRQTLLSSRLMKLLRALSTGTPTYIVPGVVGPEELSMASELNVPLLGPEPHLAQVFGTKSGCHRLLEAADVPTPPGAWQLRSRHDVLRALARLVLEHADVTRWLVKIETEAGSRGHAYLDVSRIKSLKGGQPAAAPQPPLYESVLAELEEYGGRRVRLVHPGVYPHWNAYLDMVDAVGASVEAVPSRTVGNVTASMFVEPTGEVRLQSISEPLLAPALTVMGCCHPPTCEYPRDRVADAARRVARAAFRKRIFGYLSVDFVVFLDRAGAGSSVTAAPPSRKTSMRRSVVTLPASSPDLGVWCVDVDLHWTNNAVAHHFAAMMDARNLVGDVDGMAQSSSAVVDMLSASSVALPSSASVPQATVSAQPSPLCYVYSGIVYSPGIAAIRHSSFFSLCRSRGLVYDRERRSGLVFQLVDVLLRGCVGALSIGSDMPRIVRKLADFQSLLNLELPKHGEHSADSNFAYFSAAVRQLSRLVESRSA